MAQGSRDRKHSYAFRVPTAPGGQRPHCPMAQELDSGQRKATEHVPRVPVTLMPQVGEQGRPAGPGDGDSQELRVREVEGGGDR